MKVKLSDAFKLQMGKTPARNNPEYWGEPHKWISIADIGKASKFISETKECLTDKGVTESGIKIVPAETVIMSFKLSIGKTAITAEDMYTNEAIMAFMGNGKYQIDRDYFYHFCSGTDWTAGTNKAVMGLTLNKATLSAKEINLPPLDEQRKIAAVLDKIDSLTAKRRRQLEKLDELVKSRFVEMFGDPLQDDGRYKKVPLCNMADVGSSKRIFEKEYVTEGVPFYRTKEIVELSRGNKITTELFISRERYDEICHDYGAPKAGDLLISAVGTIGTIWVVDGKNEFYFKDGNLLRVAASQNFNSIYLRALLETLIGAYKLKMSSGTAYAALTISALKDMLVYDVPMSEQEQFSAFVRATDKSKLAVQRSLDALETLKKSLMQSWFG